MPICIKYIEHVAQFAKLHGGAPGSPILRFLDMFSRDFGENKVLGETFV